MQVLVNVFHPDLSKSRCNKMLIESCKDKDFITINNIYDKYPNFDINVAEEQILLSSHDRIIFQFPFYWYSSPAMCKEYIDKVLTYNWAYGSQKALTGKEFMVCITTGGPSEAYRAGGRNAFTLDELLRPFQQSAKVLGMKYLPYFALSGVDSISDHDLQQYGKRYHDYILLQS
jgi:putative NADPH-quinone reductase